MMQTLYKSAKPVDFKDGEYYQPRLDREKKGDSISFFVRETHGWWSEEEKRLVNMTLTLSPDEGFDTYQEAEGLYKRQVQHRVTEGFRHSFTFDFSNPGRSGYEYLS